MALTKAFTTPQGFSANNAYARIKHFNGTKNSIMVDVEVHKDEAARTAEMQPIANFTLSLDLQNGATMLQMYEAVKLDSNFEGAQDC
jgi:hypothetical protein